MKTFIIILGILFIALIGLTLYTRHLDKVRVERQMENAREELYQPDYQYDESKMPSEAKM